MSYRVKFTEQADDDLDAILHYIAQDNPERALKFVDRLEERINSVLGTFPLGGTRYKAVRYFAFDNYLVVYDVDEAEGIVNVSLVTEGRRQWKVVLESRTEVDG